MDGRVRFTAAVAERYDAGRSLRETVVAAVYERITAAAGLQRGGRLLEVGAGTGVLSTPALGAARHYIGLDVSAAMLARFRSQHAIVVPALVQADMTALPFPEAVFDVVVALRVFGVVPGWKRAVRECVRVLRPAGSIVVGRAERAADSLHSLVRTERNRLLEELGVDTRRPGANQDRVIEAFSAETMDHTALLPVVWQDEVTPRQQIERNLSGWRLQSLAPDLQAQLRARLEQTIRELWGDLDRPSQQESVFALHVFRRR